MGRERKISWPEDSSTYLLSKTLGEEKSTTRVENQHVGNFHIGKEKKYFFPHGGVVASPGRRRNQAGRRT